MHLWTAFPHTGAYRFDAARLKKQWAALHQCDLEPLPTQAKVLDAWALFHSGEFQKAHAAGIAAGTAGLAVANKAACVYANYLEPSERLRQQLFLESAELASQHTADAPQNANAFYLLAYALGRYGDGMSVAKSLAQGLGKQVQAALDAALGLEPQHPDALVALGSFHADIIDKVGPLIGNMTYRVKRSTSIDLFEKALALAPDSAQALTQYSRALLMLDGDAQVNQANALLERAAKVKPLDAHQHLQVELARLELNSD
jgi:hypothetical protein